MEFSFYLLCLLVIFLLVIIYYTKEHSFDSENTLFRSILLTTYIMQLVYLSTYISSQNGSEIVVFSKIYFIMITLWFALYSFYYISFFIKAKYLREQTLQKKKITSFKQWFLILQGISILLLLISKVSFLACPLMVSVLIGFYLVLEGITLLKGIKIMPKKQYAYLLVLFIIQVFIFGFREYYQEFSLMNIGMIIIVMYCYLTLENADQKELKILKLERDYALSQSMDKSTFLKNLSHQIRTPLNTIDGFSQVILESSDEEEIKNDIQDIRTASRELIEVINGMIDLSIIESGNLELINENYNIYDLLDNTVEIIHSKLKETEVKLVTDMEEKIPEVLLGDSERISQILLNLLKNAIKYTDSGSITLKVESVKSSSICRLKFSVIDTGKGIQKEELNTIFEEKEDGGLGLAISKHLVDLMQGTIDVESTLGVGTTITVTIDQKIINDKSKEETSKRKMLRYFQAVGKRILLVDDNKLNLKVAAKLLTPYQVEVIEASSGKECLDILEHDTNFDLILMDDLMPEMSGTECLEILKKIEREDGYYIPVVVLTANVVSGMKEKYLTLGFEDYLSKPIDKYELHRILKKYLKGRK